MTKAETMLLSYYAKTFPAHLGIPFPHSFSEARRYKSVHDYLSREFSPTVRIAVLERLRFYQASIAPAVKTRPLLSYLHNETESPKTLLDYGTGMGYGAYYLRKQLPSLRQIWGVDPYLGPQESHGLAPRIAHQPDIEFAADLLNVPTSEKLDLIVIIHTLHHIPSKAQSPVIDSLLSRMAPKGMLFLYEDSWLRDSTISGCGSEFDDHLAGLTETEMVRLFLLNDQWSNSWCYRRRLRTSPHSYRCLEDWASILSEKGLQVKTSGSVDFDFERLHGVPSAWAMATLK